MSSSRLFWSRSSSLTRSPQEANEESGKTYSAVFSILISYPAGSWIHPRLISFSSEEDRPSTIRLRDR